MPITKLEPVSMTDDADRAWVVIFKSQKSADVDETEYMQTLTLLLGKAQKIDGFLGLEVYSGPEADLTMTYWRDLTAIETWRDDSDHKIAKSTARKRWYAWFDSQICTIQAHRHFEKKA